MKMRVDPARGLQDAELDALADLMTRGCVCEEEWMRAWVWRFNRRQLEILRGTFPGPDGFAQVDGDRRATRQ